MYMCMYADINNIYLMDRQTDRRHVRRRGGGGDCKGLEWLRTDIEHPSTKKSYTRVYVEGVGLITD